MKKELKSVDKKEDTTKPADKKEEEEVQPENKIAIR